MILYALTGGAGCGKSTVSKIFSSECGWKIIDADAICASLYADPGSPLTRAIIQRFGTSDANGAVDKKALADKVFGNDSELAVLNEMAHAHIHAEVMRIKSELGKSSECYALLDAPLLYECGWEKDAEKVIAVWARPEIQMLRLLKRGWSENEIRRRLAHQMSADEKLKKADYGIINNGTIDELREQCVALSNRLLNII